MSDAERPKHNFESVCDAGDGADGCDGAEEVIDICGDGGSAEDQLFDAIVGTIEQFMFDLDTAGLLRAHLPPFASVPSDHDRHSAHKRFVAIVEAMLDEVIHREFPQQTFHRVAELVSARQEELSPEVEEFVNSGCMEYQSFIAMWAEATGSAVTADASAAEAAQ